jgi:hypothetical protein
MHQLEGRMGVIDDNPYLIPKIWELSFIEDFNFNQS